MSGFSFGQPPSTGTSTGSLFGATSKDGANSGGLFGNSGSTSSPFGASNTTSTTPSLFGGMNTGAGSTTNLFGQSSGGSSLFGKKAEDNKPAEQSKPSLFGQSTSQPPATPSGSVPTLFGSTTPATTSAPQFSFANPSTTPAGPPPQSNTFGASTGGAGLFGNTQGQTKTDPPKQSTFSFGAPAPSTTNTQADSTKATTAPSLFGSMATPSSNPFGAKLPEQQPSVAQTGNSATEATKAPTFSFGAPAGAAKTSGAPTPSLFGTASTGTAPAATAAQSTPSLFGSTPASNTQPKAAGGLFGQPASTAAPTTTLFGASSQTSEQKPTFSFPTATSQPASTSQAPASTTAAPKPLFGTPMSAASTTSAATPAFKLPSSTMAAPSTTTAATTSSATPGLFSLGGTSNSTAPPTATTASAAKSGMFALGSNAASTSNTTTTSASAATANTATAGAPTLGQSSLGASTAGPAPPAQSRLRNKTLDEILTRWATDLTRYAKDFKNQGETIAQWDQIIVDNSSKIDKLYIKTRTCEKQTMSVEMQLAAVENQQNELESWLSKYENDVEEMLAKDASNQAEVGGPDQEREKTYKLAEKLNERLEDMGKDLESMVEQVNAANASLSKHTKADEPITQIVRILNSHLTQLQQIDQGTAALQAKVSSAQKAANHLGYLNGGAGAEGRAAVEDFYRSYMGRR